jgi:hypothetical protein
MSDSQLRINVKWDRTSLPVTLDLKASGEVLVAQLQKRFPKRALDRMAFQFRLSTNRDPDAADADETEVSLKADRVQAEWEDAVAWISDAPAASIYGRIEPVDSP